MTSFGNDPGSGSDPWGHDPRHGQPDPPYGQPAPPYPNQPHPTQPYQTQQFPNQPYQTQQFPVPEYPTDELPALRYSRDYGDDDYPGARPHRARSSRTMIVVATSVLLVLGLGAVAWAVLKPGPSNDPLVGATDPNAGVVVDTTSSDPTPTPEVTPTPTVQPTTRKPTPTKSKKKPVAAPPAPRPTATPSPGCKETFLPGTPATPATIDAKLAAAAGVDRFNGVSADPNPPPLSMPADMLRAFAFVESSWRPTVVACDGGIGLLQLMPSTVGDIDRRFGYDNEFSPKTLDGNIVLGSSYMQWMMFFWGANYFDEEYLDWDKKVARGVGGAPIRFGDIVIASYNYGPDGCRDKKGTDDVSDDVLFIPNPTYVTAVKNAMANKSWEDL